MGSEYFKFFFLKEHIEIIISLSSTAGFCEH